MSSRDRRASPMRTRRLDTCAEYQNEPLPENAGDDELLTLDEIAGKRNGHARGEVQGEKLQTPRP